MGITRNSIDSTVDSPERYEVLLRLGACHIAMGNYEEARRCYEESALLGADEPRLYIGLGVIALEKKQLKDSEAAFKVAIRLDKNCAEAFCGLAIVYQQKNDFAKAQQMYAKCLEIDNDNMEALSGLFQTSRQLGVFSEVEHYLNAYLKNHHNDKAVMFSLAALYVNDGRVGEAKEILLNILALDSAFTDAIDLLEKIECQLV